MYPILFKFGPIQITSFGFMMAFAFLTCAWLLRKELSRNKKDPELAYELVMAAALGGVAGAKLNFLLISFDSVLRDPIGMIFSGAGLVWYGGFIGGMITTIYWTRKLNLSVGMVAGITAPLLALGHGIGRIGCFLVGDDWGKPTDVSWGVAFPNGIDPVDFPVHPTQLYEMTALFAIFAIIWYNRKKIESNWIPLWYYLVLSGIQRFMVEYYRKNDLFFGPFTQAQIVSIILIIIGSYGLYQYYSSQVPQRAGAKSNS
ncbi:prolipoprotein diacylglyceryl transferase [Candidatus Marinimicrobia bacterium MT.SAG.4]|nr:prolipoprotein diacylglyceryl transferase [Candidatus Marinimicrobia bacterium MT.SAG.4]